MLIVSGVGGEPLLYQVAAAPIYSTINVLLPIANATAEETATPAPLHCSPISNATQIRLVLGRSALRARDGIYSSDWLPAMLLPRMRKRTSPCATRGRTTYTAGAIFLPRPTGRARPHPHQYTYPASVSLQTPMLIAPRRASYCTAINGNTQDRGPALLVHPHTYGQHPPA